MEGEMEPQRKLKSYLRMLLKVKWQERVIESEVFTQRSTGSQNIIAVLKWKRGRRRKGKKGRRRNYEKKCKHGRETQI